MSPITEAQGQYVVDKTPATASRLGLTTTLIGQTQFDLELTFVQERADLFIHLLSDGHIMRMTC
jgi:hypothetical protein